MKKLISILLCGVLVFSLSSCGKTETEDPKIESTTAVVEEIPDVKMVINASEDDTTTSIRVFRQKDRVSPIAHYYIESNKPTESIRVKTESQWGSDDQTKEAFKVESDKVTEVETNKWHTFYIGNSASNLYFHRVTLYYGETDVMLCSKTVYTPYDEIFYSEDDFTDDPPQYHPISGVEGEEARIFDLCEYALVDYAKTNHFNEVRSIEAWETPDKLILYVGYSVNSRYNTIWFSINKTDPYKYIASTNAESVANEGEGTREENINLDFYYIINEINTRITA
jgi:hypothetical protein